MIRREYWYDIHTRGLETLGVWGTYAATFKVGECSLTSHAIDVLSLFDLISQRETAKGAADGVRSSRNLAANEIRQICVRVCKAVSGTLPRGHVYHARVSEACRVKSRSGDGVQAKARKLVVLWTDVNAYRAGLSPALPPLEVGGYTVTGFQSSLGNHAQFLAEVETKQSVYMRKKNTLQTAASKVDGNNKRWYKAWQGEFAAGSPERAALSQIDTGPSQTLPGQGVFLVVQSLPDLTVKLNFDAPRATSFTLLHKGPGAAAFAVLADGLTLKSFEHATGELGEHQYKLVPHNASGNGAESVVLTVQVAQQAAA